MEAFFSIARAETEAAERSGRFKDLDLEVSEDRHLIELKVQHLAFGSFIRICVTSGTGRLKDLDLEVAEVRHLIRLKVQHYPAR